MSTEQINLPFPMFISLQGKKALVVGAGKIASRRIGTLLKFGVDVIVVAKEIPEDNKHSKINYINREFIEDDLNDIFICVACTDNRQVNHHIGQLCKEKNIHHSICDSKEECSFFFPGVEIVDNVVVAVCGDGSNHHNTKKVLDKIRENNR